ncbi:hypothetical protein B0T11DRAFT_290637 [Plectosphaerella cucumerina]|uniref:Uncharacterized protein n=1 Tax=Plectosphaerella cucumerina TaxID=40658 RepID=A0A8K0TCT2_9PEZI|nr:hypothetical protein B0T11DRAFT_290637 [Plectosphaerella cucumerina]
MTEASSDRTPTIVHPEDEADHCISQLPSALSESHEPRQTLYPPSTQQAPSFLEHSIKVQAPGAADPATTISVPTPSFVCRGRGKHVIARSQPHIPNTTILSRRSITDIKWLNNPYATAITRWGSIDSAITPSRPMTRLSDCDSKFSVSTLRSVRLERRSTSSTGGDILKENTHETPTLSSRHSLESFPALLKREWTQEWLSPPANIYAQTQEPRNDLYHLGIDARCGTSADVPTVLVDDEPVKPPQCNHALFHEDIFECGTYSTPITRRATEASIKFPLSPEINSETSSGTLSRAGKDARSGKSIPFIPVHKHQPGTPHFMDRLREGGKAVTRKLSAVFPGTRGTRAPAPSAESEDYQTEDGHTQPRTSAAVSPTVSTLEVLDPLAHIAGTSGGRHSRHGACSEDHQPHVCDSEH